MWLVIAKVIDGNGAVRKVRIYNAERKEVKLMDVSTALRFSNLIRNAGAGFSGDLVFSETGTKIPIINTDGQLLTVNSYFVVKVESNGLVHMTDSSGLSMSTIYANVVNSIQNVANAWILDGYLTGYFESETPKARGIPFML